jgi:hypothetical protein
MIWCSAPVRSLWLFWTPMLKARMKVIYTCTHRLRDYILSSTKLLKLNLYIHISYNVHRKTIWQISENISSYYQQVHKHRGVLHDGVHIEVLWLVGFFFPEFFLANSVVILPKGRALKLQVIAVLLPYGNVFTFVDGNCSRCLSLRLFFRS